MTGTIFVEQLKRSWRGILYWGIGLAFLPFLILAMAQESDFLDGYADLVEGLGQAAPGLLEGMGLDEEANTLRDPDGFVGFIMLYSVLGMSVYGVSAGMNIVANDEDEGIIDLELALPVARWRIILEKFLAYSVAAVAIAVVSYGGVLLGKLVMTTELAAEVSLGRLFSVTLNLVPATLTAMGVTTLLASLLPRKRIVSALAGVFVVGSFFLFIMDDIATSAAVTFMGRLSFFSYFNSTQAAMNGVQPEDAVVLLSATAILVALAVIGFEYRDVGV